MVKGKSKNSFNIPFVFKNHNNKIIKNENFNATGNVNEKGQGYYFVSYSKSMEISRASSTHMDNQNKLVYNPCYNTKSIELLKTSITPIPFEEQLKLRKRKIRDVNSGYPKSTVDQEFKKFHPNNDDVKQNQEFELIEDKKPLNINDKLLNSSEDINKENIKCKPKHKSTLSQLNDFLNEENSNGEEIDDISSSSFESYSKEKSTLLNIAEQKDVEIIKDNETKQIETDNTPSSTQATLGKDISLTNSLTSESMEIKPPVSNELISENINLNNDESEDVSVSNRNLTNGSREKRKRGNSQSSGSHFNRSSVALIKEKKFKKDETKKSSKGPNFVKNHKKRMGIITRGRGPFIKDTSIVQGVKGPWKIVETTTLTAGIATSPDVIHRALRNNKLHNTQHMIFHSPSLPSLNATISNEKHLISRHQ
eukprot:jgi/Orpsp1_1/1186133/evm.model.c7180000097112.1